MNTNGINTYSDFNINGIDMSYGEMQKKALKKDFLQREGAIYYQKFESLKKNSKDLKNQAYIAFSIAGAAVLCQIIFKHFKKIKFSDIETIQSLARKMTEKHNLNDKGFRAVLADKNQSICPDIYGNPVKIPEKKSKSGAFYVLPANIAVAWKNSPLALFHEIGHAVSGCRKNGYNRQAFAHYLPYYSPLPGLSCFINTSDKVNKNKNKNEKKIYNALSFIKDNSYLVSGAMFLPLLAEEFNASRLAISFLGKNAPKLAAKSLLLLIPAFCSFLLNALACSNFVKLINTKSDNLYLQKSMYKQSKNYEKAMNFNNSAAPNIAVIDEFKNKVIKVDWDDKPDMFHGQVVKTIIQAGLPQAKIQEFDTDLNEKSIKNALDEIIQSNTKFDAVNLSKSSDIKISDLSALTGLKITQQSLLKDKKIIKEKFFASKAPQAPDIKDIVQNLETLASKGVKVYVSAGNKGQDYVNLYTLADNINVIGAANRYGVVKSSFSCDNSLVNRWVKGVFKIKKIRASQGNTGFDINEDGKIDILTKDTTARVKIPQRYVYGTSFAAPYALVNDFRKNVVDN